MTAEELQDEWNLRYTERLALLLDGPGTPTPEQRRIAYDEATDAIKALKTQPA